MAEGASPQVLRRRLAAGAPHALALIDAVAWPAGRGRAFRVALGSGVVGLPEPAGEGDAETQAQRLAGGVLVEGKSPRRAGPVVLDLGQGVSHEITPAPAEWGLFAGLRTALVLTNGESAGQIARWLAFHRATQALEAALVLVRLAPGEEGAALAQELAVALEGCDLPGPVVLAETLAPLGAPDTAPEAHPLNAPDAPGKDRMTRPAPDPFRAPLGEGVVIEALRWRFLAQAAAVVCLDASDLLDPPAEGAPGLFDALEAAPEGVVALDGRRAYPWRIKAAAADFGDHVCLPFDAAGGNRRWAIRPAVLPEDARWRPTRIGGLPEPAQRWRFWRCMALRHPGTPPAALAPKSSLVESEHLRALMTRWFDARPARPPRSEAGAGAEAPDKSPGARRTAIVTTMKNEGPFILDWLAHHRAIGVSDFLVFTNDCTDGTDSFLELLQRKGLVQHRENPFRATTLKPQHAALQAAEEEAVIRKADWVICMDVDEYITIHTGKGRLADLYAAMGDANMISLTWRLFGNADVHAFEDRPVTEQFTRCALQFSRKPHQAWGFKTLFRNIGMYRKLGVHRPKGLKPDLWTQIRWLNGSGKRMPREMLRNGWRSTVATYGYDLVTLNHYAVRSAESFLVKRDRGRVNHVDRDQGLNYWFRMNNNAVEDGSVARVAGLVAQERARLMADPEIAAAHADCVARHRARIVELRADPAYAAFYDLLTSPRMEALSRLHVHFGSAVFNRGPDAIPDRLWQEKLPADFFFTYDEAEEDAPAVH